MRIARLDGIRAIAILLVFLYHHRLLTGSGRAGVDLFFVLSGLLITRVPQGLLLEKNILVTLLSQAFLPHHPTPCSPLRVVRRSIPSHKSMDLRRLCIILRQLDEHHPLRRPLLLALWSLAVEEHFYLFWPFAVKFLRRRNLIALIAFILIAEPVVRVAFTPFVHSFETIYYLTPFRLDSLAAGSLLALLTENSPAENWLRHWSATGTPLRHLSIGAHPAHNPNLRPRPEHHHLQRHRLQHSHSHLLLLCLMGSSRRHRLDQPHPLPQANRASRQNQLRRLSLSTGDPAYAHEALSPALRRTQHRRAPQAVSARRRSDSRICHHQLSLL